MSKCMPKTLAQLLAGAGESSISGNPDVTVTSIAVDSRAAEPGALFVCRPGASTDGHAHAAEAVARGATAVVAQRPVDLPAGVPVVSVPDTLAALSPIAAAFFDSPSAALTVVGVTGTNGKTTTTYFIEAIASAAGRRFGRIGTLGARLQGVFEETLEHTTPRAHDLQRLLARLRESRADGAVLEVSSHALALHRVDDVKFDVATFTNLTQDHLDFHRDFEAYRAAKRRLFDLTEAAGGVGVLNAADAASAYFATAIRRRLTYGVECDDAQLNATGVTHDPDGSTFLVRALRPARLRIRLPGPFNVANAMAALATAVALDIDVEAIAEGLESLEHVPGRMMRVENGEVAVFVDYAHTPDGLDQVLRAARAVTRGRLICVFGCGGDRDAGKRPLMGRIAKQQSDVAIVTSDNPRSEQPRSIIDQVVAGMDGERGARVEIIDDREAAIRRAIAIARAGDTVVIAGKGHEAYQIVGRKRLPFSDAEVARRAIESVRT